VTGEKIGNANRANEELATRRILGMLPIDQFEEYYGVWCEFEKQETAEAKFAACLERLEPLLQNYFKTGSILEKEWECNAIKR
jgi:putative hydrolase of HD superfamily